MEWATFILKLVRICVGANIIKEGEGREGRRGAAPLHLRLKSGRLSGRVIGVSKVQRLRAEACDTRPRQCSIWIERYSRIRSTSLSVISSFVRLYSLVVLGDSCPAI